MGQTGMGQAGGGRAGTAGVPNGPGTNLSGASAIGLGSSLLRSLADSSSGGLGTSIHIMSSFMDPSVGYAVPIKTDGLDLRLSTSFGGGMGGAMKGKGPQGPSLNLKLKF